MSAEEDREELAQLEQSWMQAMQDRDEEKLERLVAPGFRFTALHLAPEPMSREQWMGAAMGGYHIISFAYLSMDIDVFGDTAVIHARYSQIANYDAVNLSHVYWLTDIWARQDGQWRVVARHSSILS
jgi:ketosteroid isomerase-like protein